MQLGPLSFIFRPSVDFSFIIILTFFHDRLKYFLRLLTFPGRLIYEKKIKCQHFFLAILYNLLIESENPIILSFQNLLNLILIQSARKGEICVEASSCIVYTSLFKS